MNKLYASLKGLVVLMLMMNATVGIGQQPALTWAKNMGGTYSNIKDCPSVGVDDLGYIYTSGSFSGTMDFDPGPGIYNLTSQGPYNMYVSKLDAAGNFVWAKRVGGGTSGVDNFSLALDALGNVHITGACDSIVDLDPGPGIYHLPQKGPQSAFILKLDPSGNFVWAKGFTSTYKSEGYSITVDHLGNVFTSGIFSDTTDFNPGVAIHNLVTPNYQSNIFISKLDSSGNFVWAKGFTSDYYMANLSYIATNAMGDVYIGS